MEKNELELLSIAKTASLLQIGKDTLHSLINEGKIGVILVGKRKKIPYMEIVRFQKESIITGVKDVTPIISDIEIRQILNSPFRRKKSLRGEEILNKLILEG